MSIASLSNILSVVKIFTLTHYEPLTYPGEKEQTVDFNPGFHYLHAAMSFSVVQIMLCNLTLAADNQRINIKRFPKVYEDKDILNALFNK